MFQQDSIQWCSADIGINWLSDSYLTIISQYFHLSTWYSAGRYSVEFVTLRSLRSTFHLLLSKWNVGHKRHRVSHCKPLEFHNEKQGSFTLNVHWFSDYKSIMRTASVYSISDLRISENPRPRFILKDIDLNMTLKYSNWDRGQTSL